MATLFDSLIAKSLLIGFTAIARLHQLVPHITLNFAEALKKMYVNYTKDPTLLAFNDVMTPSKFENVYCQNLQRELGDSASLNDSRTKQFLQLYASNQSAFFYDFAHAMKKLSVYGIKTGMGRKGEVKHQCDAFNSIHT